MTYLTEGEVHPAIFIKRENRFISIVKYDRKKIRCHLPNPGRMIELLIPNKSIVYIRFHNNTKRKTQASLVAVKCNAEIIQLDSNLVAKWLPHEFRENTVPGLTNWNILKQEFKIGNHRFDFVLKNSNQENVITEVKSTTKVIDHQVACFPDAISIRATKQSKSLIDLSKKNQHCMVLFIVQRTAVSFWSCKAIDYKYNQIFLALIRSKVKIHIIQSRAKLISFDNGNSHYLQVSLLHELPLAYI